MSEGDSSHTVDVQSTIDTGITSTTENKDSAQRTEIPKGKINEESVENGNISDGEEKQASEGRTNIATSPPPPPVVNPWNKNTKNARNSSEKGWLVLHEFASKVTLAFIVISVFS